jgi:FkbM family methyltransferase
MPSNFLPKLLLEIFSDRSTVQLRNTDFWRYPELEPKGILGVKGWMMDQWTSVADRLHFSHTGPFAAGHATTTLLNILSRLPDYERTHESLHNEESRDIMIKVLAFRILTNRYVKLPVNQPEFWKFRRRLEAGEFKDLSAAPLQVDGSTLPMYDLHPLGYPVRLYAKPLYILNTFLLKQYESRMPSTSMWVRDGDIIIDGGACWGDTSLYFAYFCGARGKVFAFEILPENLKVLERNIASNSSLGNRVECVRLALWDRSGEVLGYTSRTSGTSLLNGNRSDGSVETITIDDFVERQRLERVDLIKLDVEGAEPNVLCGAEKTIRTFRPRLAISIYHSEDDLLRIPQYIQELDCGYTLTLDHFTIYNEETILFAHPPQG